MVEFTSEINYDWYFLFLGGRLLIIYIYLLIHIQLYSCYVYFCVWLVVHVLMEFIHFIKFIKFMKLEWFVPFFYHPLNIRKIINHYSFLISDINLCIPFYFFVILARCLFIYLIFWKNHLLVLLMLSTFVFIFIDFYFNWIIYFLLHVLELNFFSLR